MAPPGNSSTATGVSLGPHLAALLARVEAAEGPDRELDGEAWVAIIWTRENTDPSFYPLLDEGRWRDALCSVQYDWPAKDWVPAYTASVDASLALCSRGLPGWMVAHICQQDDKSWWVELRQGFATSYSAVAMSDVRIRFKTPALALIAAVLKALIAQGEAGTAERSALPREDQP